MALGGHGLFLAPSFLIADELAAGLLVPLLAEHRPVEFAINAIYPHRHHLSTKVRVSSICWRSVSPRTANG